MHGTAYTSLAVMQFHKIITCVTCRCSKIVKKVVNFENAA